MTIWRQARRSPRGAFTLIELLVVMMIIGILTSLVTFALWDSLEAARISRTRAQIQKINELLMTQWEAYRTRPLPVRTSKNAPELAAAARLNAARALMRMELPDRITDVLFSNELDTTTTTYPLTSSFTVQPSAPNKLPFVLPANTFPGPTNLNSYPAKWLAYRRRIAQAGQWTPSNQQAECLYLIIASLQDGTRNGLDFFRDNEIGDTDGDGMLEILDGWNRPIRFLRWAPGFSSALQNVADLAPDPFDPLKVDPRWKNNNYADAHYPDDRPSDYPVGSLPSAPIDVKLDDPYQLFPLVYSAGPDGKYHIIVDIYDTLTDATDDYDNGNSGLFANGASLLYYKDTYNDVGSANYFSYTPITPNYPPRAWPTKLRAPAPPRINVQWRLWVTSPPNDPYVILPNLPLRIGSRYYNFDPSLTGADDNIDSHNLAVR